MRERDAILHYLFTSRKHYLSTDQIASTVTNRIAVFAIDNENISTN